MVRPGAAVCWPNTEATLDELARLYELLGRKQARLEVLDGEYGKLLDLLCRIKCGEVKAESVSIDLTTRSWKIETQEDA